MREILFRGKCNSEWVYGHYYSKRGKDIHNNEGIFHFIKNEEANHPVNPQTVGQYTGLKDKEGNRIFEGDILEGAKQTKWEVVFCKGMFMLLRLKSIGFIQGIPKNYKILGNIHDNPELLEEVK